MRQAIHIFRKDARHCWPYIGAVLAITAVHAWRESVEVPDYQGSLGTGLTGVLLPLLMVVAWWFAIGAAVHGESPIGDRQFWTTRPYSWKSLLTAKLLFVAAFLMLPLLLSDCFVLLVSAYDPLTLVPGLLWRQCWLLGFLALPFVLAALTRATREFVLAGLLFYVVSWIVLYLLSLLSVHAYAGSETVVFVRPSWIWDAVAWLLPVAAFALLVWQYAYRRTILVRVLAISLGGLWPFVTLMSFGRMAQSSPAYAVTREDDPRYRNITVQLAAGSGDMRARSVLIPLKISGWPRDLMTYELLRVTATAPETRNQVWTRGPLLNTTTTTTDDGRELIWVSLDDPRMLAPQTVDLSVSMSFNLYRRQGTAEIGPQQGWTRMPEFGAVRLVEDSRGTHVIWRTALKPGTPDWTYDLSDGESGLVTNAGWPGAIAGLPASPAWFAMSPVYSYAASGLTVVHGSSVTVVHAVPRTLLLTVKRLVARLPRELKIPNVRLTDDH